MLLNEIVTPALARQNGGKVGAGLEKMLNGEGKILIVDDTTTNLRILKDLLIDEYQVFAAKNGPDALDLADRVKPDLILLDIMMPEMDGYEVCRYLKNDRSTQDIPVIFISGNRNANAEQIGFELGATDYITKPFNGDIVRARVRNHLKLYLYQHHLEHLVRSKTAALKEGYLETIGRLTLATEFKDSDTGNHIRRISYFTRELAKGLGLKPKFCESIFYASPMHDIGKVTIPDSILLKVGPLTDPEWEIMKSHTQCGAKILEGSKSPYLTMGKDIALYHHERWDGGGYPYGLRGEKIPLSARIMNIADQYDALRSMRPYKPAFSHEKAMSIIVEGDGRTLPGHFDPKILSVFIKVADKFDEIFKEMQ